MSDSVEEMICEWKRKAELSIIRRVGLNVAIISTNSPNCLPLASQHMVVADMSRRGRGRKGGKEGEGGREGRGREGGREGGRGKE